jgi:hypothetical protein
MEAGNSPPEALSFHADVFQIKSCVTGSSPGWSTDSTSNCVSSRKVVAALRKKSTSAAWV